MHCRTLVTGAPVPRAPAVVAAVGRRRSPTQQTTQRRVIRSLLGALGERFRMDGPEHRPAMGLDQRDHRF